MAKDIKEKQFFQNILLKLSDGKEIQASVPAFAFTDKDIQDVIVEEIKITEPKEMPTGMSFEYV